MNEPGKIETTGAGGPLSRRNALRLFGVAAAAVPVAGVLASCSSDSGGSSNTTSSSPTSSAAPQTSASVTSSAPPATSDTGSGASSPATSATAPATSSAAPSGSLTLAYLGDASQQTAFNALFAEFNKTYPQITIKATGIASGDWATFATTISTQLAGGKVYDIVDVATEGQRLFSSKGVLEPLDDYMARDKDVVDDYYNDIDPNLKAWSLKYGSPDGKTYFIPGGYNTVCAYINTAVFQKAGVDIPGDDWTWDDMQAAGKAMKEKADAFLLPIGYGFPFADIMPWLTTNGTSTLDADWKTPTINSPEAIEAATFVKSLLDAGYSPKPGGAFDVIAQMQKDKLAMFGAGRWSTLDVRRVKMMDKVQIVPWPIKAKHGSPAGWDGWPIFKASQNKEAAWTFLKWMMSKDASIFYAQTGGTNVPARNSVANSSYFTDNAPKGTENLVKAISYATAIPSPDQGAAVQNVITKAWQAAILGTSSVSDALNNAANQLKPLL